MYQPKMLSLSLLLFVGLCESAILRDLQMEFSSRFPTPRDLLKTRLVDKKWIGVEKIFEKITPKAGLFENKQTNEFVFETKENSWHQNEIIEKWGKCFKEDNSPYFQIPLFEDKNWTKMFLKLISILFDDDKWWKEAGSFIKALAEIVDVNADDANQRTSIHVATWYYDTDLIEILLQRSDANPNAKDFRERTPLHYAAQFTDNIRLIEILLKYGAHIDDTDDWLQTPLMIAVEWGKYDSVKVLLDHKANPHLSDVEGKTVLHYYAEREDEFDPTSGEFARKFETMEMILERGAEIDAIDKNCNTPLEIAVENWYYSISNYGQSQVVEFFLDHGAQTFKTENYFPSKMRREKKNRIK